MGSKGGLNYFRVVRRYDYDSNFSFEQYGKDLWSDEDDTGRDRLAPIHNYREYNYIESDQKNEDGVKVTYVGFHKAVSSAYVRTDVTDIYGGVEQYTYNHKLLLVKYVKGYGSTKDNTFKYNKKIENFYETAYEPTGLLVTKRITTSKNFNSSTKITATEYFQYDSQNYGDLIYYWDSQASGRAQNDKHKVSYEYNNPYHLMTKKTYRQDDNTIIEERYEYTSDSKAVRLVSIWEIKNGVEKLKKKTEYIYDCPYYDNAQRKSWNVQEERQYIYNEEEGHWNDYISTFFEYKDNNEARNGKFNELYMTRKYVTGVNNSYGEPIAARTGKAEDAGIIDELYEYDWFGNVIRKQDGKGNGIRYEYDKLNRLVKEYREVDGSEKRWIYTTSLNENSVTIEDENKNQVKYYYDVFGNMIAEVDPKTGENLKRYEYDPYDRISAEYTSMGSTKYYYGIDGRMTLQESRNGFVWFENSLPTGATTTFDGENTNWSWMSNDINKQNYFVGFNTKRADDVLDFAFENAVSKMKVNQGDKIFIEIERDSTCEEVLIDFKADGSWGYRAYWNINNKTTLVNTRTQFTRIGDLPQSDTWEWLVIPANLIGLEGKTIDGMHIRLGISGFEQEIKFGRVGILAGDNVPQVLTRETYNYDDSFNGQYVKVSKTLEGDVTSPSIKVHNYFNKLGQLEKIEREHAENNYIDIFRYDFVGNKIAEKIARAEEEDWNLTEGKDYTTRYGYDFAGRVTEVETVNKKDGTIVYNTAYTNYDALGRKVSVIDFRGYKTEYKYDNAGRLIEEKIPFDNVAPGDVTKFSYKKYDYDLNGNLIRERISSNAPDEEKIKYNMTEYEYNDRNMLMKVITYKNDVYNEDTGDPVNRENYTQYYYDAAGNRIRMYTGLTSPITIKGIKNGIDQIEPANAEFSATKYEYDQLNRLIKIIDPLGKEESYTYTNGLLSEKRSKNQSIIYFEYDGLGRILSQNAITPDQKGNVSRSFTYNFIGNRATMDSNVNYSYDDLGRLIREEDSKTGIVKEYGYDANDNITFFKLIQNDVTIMHLKYTYDWLNRMEQVIEVDDNQNETVVTVYSYDANGNREELSYPNIGLSTSYSYNSANQLESLTNVKKGIELSKYEYAYFLSGNQKRKTEKIAGEPERTTEYTYDGLNRLATVNELTDNIITTYQYDAYNNRNKMTVDNGANSYTVDYDYNKNNWLQSETKRIGELEEITRYSYDDNGNMIYKGKEVIKPAAANESEQYQLYITGNNPGKDACFYEYDGFNQLIQAVEGDKTIRYIYNGDGLRISKSVNNVITNYILDGANVIAELNENNDITSEYLRGVNLIACDIGTQERQYYTFNGHGDVVQLISSGKNTATIDKINEAMYTVEGRPGYNPGADLNKDGMINIMDLMLALDGVSMTYEYDAFGNEKVSDINDTNPFRYCGEYFDKETETYYLRARYYSPGIGRFISEDPIRDGLNWYVYCENNPIILFDPFGLAPTKEEAAAMAEHIYQDIPLKDDNDPAGNRALRTVAGWRLIDIWSEGTVKMGIYIRDTDDWKNPSEYVLVFKGTSTKNVKDWVDDVLAYKTNFAPNMYTAMNFGKSFVESHSQEVTFVGHSKGGGEAIAAACYTFRNAITFNAANFAFERYHLSGRRSTIDNYYVEGEILSATIGTATIGTTHWLPTQYWITQGTKSRGYTATFTSPDPIANHSMKAIFRAFGME